MLSDLLHIDWNTLAFRYPWVLFFMLIIPLLIYRQTKAKKAEGYLSFSTLDGVKSQSTLKTRLLELLPYFSIMALAFIILALARPVEVDSQEWIESNGYDIMICIDVSSSMLEQDFLPNRLEASKELSEDFIDKRKGSRIGLVEFSRDSYLRVPLTTDYNLLKKELRKIQSGDLKPGTDIGDALVTAIDRIKDIPAKNKIVILITDGDENSGHTDALTAMEIAKPFGIRIYSIGVGGDQDELYVTQDASGRRIERKVEFGIDEKLLEQVSSETGGVYYRARNTEGLEKIYNDIDELEKSKIKAHSSVHQKDVFMPFAFIAILLLLLQWILHYVVLKPKP